MILDKLTNLKKYLPQEYISQVSVFLYNLSPDMAEGRYEIMGDRIFARVMSYATSPKEECAIEAHDRYIDIQATLTGAEGIDIFQRSLLTIKTPYDVTSDAVFFERENAIPYASNVNLPGYFSMIFPEEAHRPQEHIAGQPGFVKKFVIKMEVEPWVVAK